MTARLPIPRAIIAGVAFVVSCSHAPPRTNGPLPYWSTVSDPITLRNVEPNEHWEMRIAARNDGWIDFFLTGRAGTKVPIDAVVTPTGTTIQPTFYRALVEPAVVEQFLRAAENPRGPVSFNVANPKDTATRYPTKPIGFWMSWFPPVGQRIGSGVFELTVGIGCIGLGDLPNPWFLTTMTKAESDGMLAALGRAVVNARRLRAKPAPLRANATRRRDEVACPAIPLAGNPTPHYPVREAVGRTIQADVHVDLVIDSTGHVTRATPSPISALASDEGRAFMKEAATTLEKWRFTTPRMADGRPASQELAALVRFLPPAPARNVVNQPLDTNREIYPALDAARADTSDLLVIGNRQARGEDAVQRFIVTRDQVTLSVVEGGPRCGIPIVIVNYPGVSVERWRQVKEQLVDAYWIVQYDLRGHGKSSPSPGADYSIEAHVNDLTAVMDSLRVPPAILVSQAEGWKIAMTYAARHRDRVLGTLTFVPADGHTMPPAAKATWIEQIRALASGKSNNVPGWDTNFPLNAGLVDVVISDVRHTDPLALTESIDKIFSYDIGPALLAYPGPKVVAGPYTVQGASKSPAEFGLKLVPGPQNAYATLLQPHEVAGIIQEERGELIMRGANYRACPP